MQSQRSFFDPALIEKWGAAFIREDKIDGALARLIPKVSITKGSFSDPARDGHIPIEPPVSDPRT
jgi:hypothetical protein